MPWLELSLTLAADRQPACEDALEELGALSVTLQDADAETPDERAIFEPGVDQTPLWDRVVLSALFEARRRPRRPRRRRCARAMPELQPAHAGLPRRRRPGLGTRLDGPVQADALRSPTVDRAVERRRASTNPMPSWCAWTRAWPSAPARIRPPRCAWSGWTAWTWPDARVIDYGCGSGVLAIAALKLGAAHAIGVDNDPQALTATRDNAERNGVGDRLEVYLPEDAPTAPADVFVANILAAPLAELAERFAAPGPAGRAVRAVGHPRRPGSTICWSATRRGSTDLRVAAREDWVRIDGRRRA